MVNNEFIRIIEKFYPLQLNENNQRFITCRLISSDSFS